MSVKKAQKIVDSIHSELGISLVTYQLSDLQFLKDQLEDFLDLEVETDNLRDPDEPNDEFGLDEIEEEEEEGYDA